MSLSQFFRIAGLVTLILGVGLILFPEMILQYFANGQVPNDFHFVRYLGTALIGFGVLNWYGARFVSKPEIALIALVANFTSLVLATSIDLVMYLDGTLAGRNVLILLLHVSFSIGFGYYINQTRHLLARPERAMK